jgi:hypothetical protein
MLTQLCSFSLDFPFPIPESCQSGVVGAAAPSQLAVRLQVVPPEQVCVQHVLLPLQELWPPQVEVPSQVGTPPHVDEPLLQVLPLTQVTPPL